MSIISTPTLVMPWLDIWCASSLILLHPLSTCSAGQARTCPIRGSLYSLDREGVSWIGGCNWPIEPIWPREFWGRREERGETTEGEGRESCVGVGGEEWPYIERGEGWGRG